MTTPPPGYDDESVVTEKRLKILLGEFENEINKVARVFEQTVPAQFEIPSNEKNFSHLRHTAEELGSEYSLHVEKMISDYESFRKSPDRSKLDQVFTDIKNLQLLLS